jgi:hypothetical protein
VALFVVVFVLLLFVWRHFRMRTPMVYQLKGHDLIITFTNLGQGEPETVVALGSERRTFQLEEFIKFWTDMYEVGRQAIDAHVEMTSSADVRRKGGTANLYHLERNDLTITFTCLGQKTPKIVLSLGTEVRTLRFEEFIDFWQDMIKLAPDAADTHIAYIERSTRRDTQRKL